MVEVSKCPSRKVKRGLGRAYFDPSSNESAIGGSPPAPSQPTSRMLLRLQLARLFQVPSVTGAGLSEVSRGLSQRPTFGYLKNGNFFFKIFNFLDDLGDSKTF